MKNAPQSFMQMMSTMQSVTERLLLKKKTRDTIKITNKIILILSSFDPGDSVCVRDWFKRIFTAVNTYQISNYDIRIKVF